jgi:hypothetical protein
MVATIEYWQTCWRDLFSCAGLSHYEEQVLASSTLRPPVQYGASGTVWSVLRMQASTVENGE